ncbi:MAG: GNAT family N-acetyltransferase, partial [Psychrosphaera sp.]|nr:GNAT family N-acetyltransferase [Psychrosphaera sp.]
NMQNWRQYRQQLINNRHRGLGVIAGEFDWCLSQLSANQSQMTLWLGDNSLPNTTELNGKQALQWLGQECEQLVINAHTPLNSNDLDLNALGALGGTLKAGGICYWLCPALSDWSKPLPIDKAKYTSKYPPNNRSNRLTRHLINTIEADKNLILLEQSCDTKLAPIEIKPQPLNPFNHSVYKTEQQQTAVEKIKRVALGHRRRPLVLTADRGRGKSSALGIALAELLIEGKQKIIISAPRVASVHAVFARAVELLSVIKQSATELVTEQGTLQFMPPDELIRVSPSADLIMIDEAAAIPAPMLTQMVNQYSRIVFTSTIAGYEGTGRGFEIRFKQTLNQLTPNWQAYSMDQPIRWAINDPLEQFINQALMLNAKAAFLEQADSQIVKSELEFTYWDRDKLPGDNPSLSQIVGLLTLSHYKTTPNDFKHLLDGSDVALYTLSKGDAIVATALIAIEGDLSDDLCQQVWQGERRPKGHLLPQTLSCHAGFVDAPKYRYARVIRIAVHPDIHSQGIGSQLLDQLTDHVKQQGIDFVDS